MTKVDALYDEYKALKKYLNDNNQVSFETYASDNFRKVLIIAAASEFEEEIKNLIINFSKNSSEDDKRLVSFVKIMGVERHYHTYFDWSRDNAGRFLRLFGDEFKNAATTKIESDAKLTEAVKSFMEIGRERNILLHENYSTIYLQKTADEYYELYKKALLFIEFLKKELE